MRCYAFFARNAFRWIVAVAAVGGVQVGGASTYPNAQRLALLQAAYGNVLGNSSTINIATGTGTPWTTSSYGLGNATGRVGNFALAQSGSSVVLGGTVKTPLGATGKVVEAVAKAPISRAAFVRGLGAVVGGPGGLALLALPLVVDWLNRADGFRVNPETGKIERASDEEGVLYSVAAQPELWARTKAAACQLKAASLNNGSEVDGDPGQQCSVVFRNPQGAVFPQGTWGYVKKEIPYTDWYPASMDDIAMYMDQPEAPVLTPQVVEQAVTGAGVDPFGAQGAKVSVSGPSSVPGAKTTSSTQTRVLPGTTTEAGPGYNGQTQPATRTDTSTGTHNVTYNNNVVNYTTTTVTNTTITNNVTGDTDTTGGQTETEGDSDAEDKPDLCEKNPDILACQKPDLDVPEGEIPRADANVSYQVEDTFGSGACPADVHGTINGKSVKLYDFAQTCSYVSTYVRPLLLLMCALGALFIVMPGRADA